MIPLQICAISQLHTRLVAMISGRSEPHHFAVLFKSSSFLKPSSSLSPVSYSVTLFCVFFVTTTVVLSTLISLMS
ncbi:hypothetical protein Hdeb2414_s0004g00135681 [Helianthus debilis subsp. tardiflorus]